MRNVFRKPFISVGFLVFSLVALLGMETAAWGKAEPRFFLMGDGSLVLNQQKIQYRNRDWDYLEDGLKAIHRIFKANWSEQEERLSLRFIEILDYLQDGLDGKTYRLRSGYRSPNLNQSLRNKGKLAAQSSMHVEGAAGDLVLVGVPSSKIFEYVKSLNCCGIGWYHSQHFHLDAGPPRYWDEKTSKTEDKTPQQNEKIILQADFDRYYPGETLDLKFMRVTEYPIGVRDSWQLVPMEPHSPAKSIPLNLIYPLAVEGRSGCKIIPGRTPARQIQGVLPKSNLPPGRYSIKVAFCNTSHFEKMPAEILSRPIEILPPRKDPG